MLKPLFSTAIQCGLSISTEAALYQQAGELLFDYDPRSEISEFTRWLLPLIFIYLTAVACWLDDKIKALAGYCRGWWLDVKLTWYAATNNGSAYCAA